AINVMSAGVTNAICYIFPGMYQEQVQIDSNNNSGYMVITAVSNANPPILYGSSISNYGIQMFNVGYVAISNLIIRNYINGISFSNNSTNNLSYNNTIYSNDIGIYINGKYNTIMFNSISNNSLYGIKLEANSISNCLSGNTICSNGLVNIYITNSDNNSINNNNISMAAYQGIFIRNGNNNIIASNNIYNNSNGIYILYGDNNSVITNNIYNNSNGIRIEEGISNIIFLNSIYNNNQGVLFVANAVNNYITRNNVENNQIYGIGIASGSDNNYIVSNIIQGDGSDQDKGINIINGAYNKIYRNLIRNNLNYGIYLEGTATNIEIINNTIFKSINQDGIFWTNESSGEMFNNIILSNGYTGGGYGIKCTTTGQVYAAYNDLYGNQAGVTNGNISWGNGNVFTDPMIDTSTTFEIILNLSAAVDSGTNIPGVTDDFYSKYPDMGWKESSLSLTNIPLIPGITDIEIVNYNELIINWQDLQNESAYYLYRNSIDDTNSANLLVILTYNTTSYIDTSVSAEQTYYYWLKAKNRFGLTGFSKGKYIITPSIYFKAPYAVFPTVFNPDIHVKAKIYFTEDKPEVSIKIYDVAGNIVKTWKKVSGTKFVEWDGKHENGSYLSIGVYIVYVKGKNINEKIKMILTR
ncbi:right-handed parallel beta-helix repeat-containing protein, partial [Candidatus Babeliales bacterium]|nr:right-handed parallel beta-helix repeat-containing protein [Candidatus Babeliales bacterium]